MIPKIIMQTWKNNDIPEHWKSSVEGIKLHMPEWKYVLMTDEDNLNFVKTYFVDFLPYYNNFKYGIQRADAIRYMYLYMYGGLYIDLDIEITHPLDELFEKGDLFLVKSGNVSSYLTNSFMASKPGNRFWLEVIEEMKKDLPIYAQGKHMHVMMSTGPMMLTRVASKTNIPYTLIPSTRVKNCSVCDVPCVGIEGTWTNELKGSSWIGTDTKIYLFFMCHFKEILIALLVIICIIIILFILLPK